MRLCREASTATISRVNRTLRDSTGGYQAVLERMEPETDLHRI